MKKSYKNYMVMEISEEPIDGIPDWMVACFSDHNTAKAFADAFIPKTDIDRIEIWGTDEDTDTYKSADTLYIRNLTDGTCTDLDEFDPYVANLAVRIRRTEERLCSPGLEEEELSPTTEIAKFLETVEGCHSMIEYLLDNIEVME